jgi:hypothetical protein
MIDRYTKVVLTVIGISLAVIAFKMLLPSNAVALGEGCGAYHDPCNVRIAGGELDGISGSVDVWVENWP